MKIFTSSNKKIRLPIANNSSQNSFIKRNKLGFSNGQNKVHYYFKTSRIHSPNLINEYEKDKGLTIVNSFRLYSNSNTKTKRKILKNIENKCPGGHNCINYEKYIKIKEKYQKLIHDNNSTNELNNYFPFLLKQKETMYLQLKEENNELRERIKKYEFREKYYKLLENKTIKFKTINSTEKKDSKNEYHTINKYEQTNNETTNTEKINNNNEEINVSSVLYAIKKIKKKKNITKREYFEKPRTKSLIFDQETFKLTLSPKKKEKEEDKKTYDINDLKYYFQKNKDSAFNQYNKIISYNNKRIFKNSTIKVSFLVTPENLLKKMAFNPNLEIIYNLSQDYDTFIDRLSKFSEEKIFDICNTLISTIKDFQEIIKLIIRIQEFLVASETIVESILSDDFCTVLIQKTCLILKCERASVFIYDRLSDMLILHDGEGLKKNEIKIPKDKGIVGSVFLTGEKEKIDDVYLDKRFNKDVDKKTNFKTRNMICFPLKDKDGEIFGAIQAINKVNGSFDSDDVEFMEIFNKEASCILKSKLNLGETNNIISKMKLIISYSNDILGIVNLKELTKKTEDLFTSLFYVSTSRLYFYDYEKNDLVHLIFGKDDVRIKLMGILKLVFRNREMHACPNIKNCKYYNDLSDLYSDGSLVTFPIVCEGDVICIIQTLFPGKISEKTESLKENESVIIQQFAKILSRFIMYYTNNKPKNILKMVK